MNGKVTYEKILEHAYELFATLGYEQTSLTTIAKKIGISKPALYYYFPSKEKLFETLYVFIIEGMTEDYTIKNLPDDMPSLIHLLTSKGHSDIKYLKNNPLFPSILKQYFLLGKRHEKIHHLTLELEKMIVDYYTKLMDCAVKLELIPSKNKMMFVELFVIFDHGIFDKSDTLESNQLMDMWSTFVKKMLQQ